MINLGDINFGLGVDTRRLSKSIGEVKKFGATVEKAAQSSAKSSKATQSALQRQEKAALGALQQILKFNEASRKSGAPSKLLTNSARAYKELTTELTRGKLSTLDFQRAQARFTASMGASTRSLLKFKKGAKSTTKSTGDLNDKLRNLSGASILAIGPLSGIGARLTAITGIIGRSTFAMAAFIGGITAGGIAISKLSSGAIKTAIEMDKVRARLESVTSSTVEAAKSFDKMRKLSEATGSNFVDVANGYAKITAAAAGTKLAGKGVSQVFEDIVFASAKFRINQQDLNGVLKAFEQIMSKGVVQSEELRGQLGDRLVGAFNIAAQSMGLTTMQLNKMLKAGKVLSDDFLPKFAAAFRKSVGADQIKQVTGLQASIGNLANATTFFNDKFDKTLGISILFQKATDSLTSTIRFFERNLITILKVIGAVGAGILAIVSPQILLGFLTLAKAIRGAALAMIMLNGATLANPFGAIAATLIKLTLFVAGAAAGYALLSRALSDTAEQQVRVNGAIDEFIRTQDKANGKIKLSTREYAQELTGNIIAEISAAGVEARLLQDKMKNIFEGPQLGGAGGTRIRLSLFNDMKKQYDALQQSIADNQKRLEGLASVEDAAIAKAKALLVAKKAIASTAEIAAKKQISQLQGTADATRQSKGALKAYQTALNRTDSIEKFRSGLAKLKNESINVSDLTKKYAQAIYDLYDAQQMNVLEKFRDKLSRIVAETKALGQGKNAVEELKKSFARTDTIQKFKLMLEAAGFAAATVKFQIDKLTGALKTLDDAAKKASIKKAMEDATKSTIKLKAETKALLGGEKTFKSFQLGQQFTDGMKNYTKSLEDAKTPQADINRLINEHAIALLANINAQDRYNSIKKDSKPLKKRIAGLSKANLELVRMQATLNAMQESPKALIELNKSFARTDAISRYSKQLKDAGMSQQNLNIQMTKFISLYDALQAKQKEFSNLKNYYEGITSAISDGFNSMGDAIVAAIGKGKFELSTFGNIARKVIADVLTEIIKLRIITPLKNMFFGFLNNVTGGLISLPARASGGPVQKGKPYMVGEKGPEPFIPDQNGTILPSGSSTFLGSGSGSGSGTAPIQITQIFQISLGVAETVRAEFMSLAPTIKQLGQEGVAEAVASGGSYSRLIRGQ